MRTISKYFLCAKANRVFILVILIGFIFSTVPTGVHAVGEDERRPWSDLSYEEWPVFKEKKIKIKSRKVEYIDTKVTTYFESDPAITWIDNNRLFLSYRDDRNGKKRFYSRIYDIAAASLTDFRSDAVVRHFDKNSGVVDLEIVSPEGNKTTFSQVTLATPYVALPGSESIDAADLYKRSASGWSCQVLTPMSESRFYWNNEDCKKYFILSKARRKVILLHDYGRESAVFENIVDPKDRLLSGLEYYQFLDRLFLRLIASGATLSHRFYLLDRLGNVDEIDFPPRLVAEAGRLGDYKKAFPNIIGIQPSGAGLLVATTKHTYLVSSHHIFRLSRPVERRPVWGGAGASDSTSPDGCKVTYASSLRRGISVFSYFEKETLKIKDFCQGEP